MPKYLVQASYTGEGLKGLQEGQGNRAQGCCHQGCRRPRRQAGVHLLAFGEDDVVVIFELPDNVAAARLAIAMGASGFVRTRTTPLLSVEEADQALGAPDIGFRAPGR
jgi:uncharacterized protein with GYD domain